MKKLLFLLFFFFVCNGVIQAQVIKKGYRGFIEAGYAFGVGTYGKDRATFLTTHGYQFNPYIFAGVGSGINAFFDERTTWWSVPIYADLKIYFMDNDICPFFDVKAGYSVADIEGVYLCPSIGCRMKLGNKTALFASLGYEFQKANFRMSTISYQYNSILRMNVPILTNKTSKETCGGITLKVGFEF